MSTGMEFLLLGPLEVRAEDGAAVPIAGGQPRALLALLLLEANQPVSADRIALALWGDDAPADSVKAVRVVVSRLRRSLDEDVLRHSPAGYCLRVRPGELDAERFAELVTRAGSETDPRVAADVLGEALALWRGPALADVAFAPFAQAAITRLEEERLEALELRIDADLKLGRHAELVPELQALADQQPLRERLHGQLMLALYRSGRQADALDAYRRLRETLVEELGLEPGPDLRELETAILRHDPALAAPVHEREAPASPRRSRRLVALLALGTVAGVATGMVALNSSGSSDGGGAASATSAETYRAEVVRVCVGVNESSRQRDRDARTLRAALRRAKTTTQQRNAVLVATRASLSRGSHNLADLRSLRPPEASRALHEATDDAWERSVARVRELSLRLDRAATRREFLKAIDFLSRGRPAWQEEQVTVTAGLQRLAGPDCDIRAFDERPVFLPGIPSAIDPPRSRKPSPPPDVVPVRPLPPVDVVPPVEYSPPDVRPPQPKPAPSPDVRPPSSGVGGGDEG
jgi:DNA-binding SARP family transcriptional activator